MKAARPFIITYLEGYPHKSAIPLCSAQGLSWIKKVPLLQLPVNKWQRRYIPTHTPPRSSKKSFKPVLINVPALREQHGAFSDNKTSSQPDSAEDINFHGSNLVRSIMIIPKPPVIAASWTKYYNTSIDKIYEMLSALCQNSLKSKDWLFTSATKHFWTNIYSCYYFKLHNYLHGKPITLRHHRCW